MESKPWNIIELNPDKTLWNFKIPYVWMTKEYGRAEFSICICWKRGKVSELWISPAQQVGEERKLYHVLVGFSDSVTFPHEAHVWLATWCKEHKAQNVSLYVPDYTDTLHISLLSTVSLQCLRTKEG